jgi:hypothetical protein
MVVGRSRPDLQTRGNITAAKSTVTFAQAEYHVNREIISAITRSRMLNKARAIPAFTIGLSSRSPIYRRWWQRVVAAWPQSSSGCNRFPCGNRAASTCSCIDCDLGITGIIDDQRRNSVGTFRCLMGNAIAQMRGVLIAFVRGESDDAASAATMPESIKGVVRRVCPKGTIASGSSAPTCAASL